MICNFIYLKLGSEEIEIFTNLYKQEYFIIKGSMMLPLEYGYI